MTEPQELLRAYVEQGSDDAFREIVHRYLNLVHTTALRRSGGSTDMAEEITQTVFIDLARHAREGRGPMNDARRFLGGWLHRHTCFVASTLLRSAQRRLAREHTAAMHAADPSPEDAWKDIAPALDDALDELGEMDRAALVLRFYEALDLREVGRRLGINDDTAQKRVARALDRLRDRLTSKGVTVSALVLTGLLADLATEAAPTGLLDSVTATSLEAARGLAPARTEGNSPGTDANWSRWLISAPGIAGLGVALALLVGSLTQWIRARPDDPAGTAFPSPDIAQAALSSAAVDPAQGTPPTPVSSDPSSPRPTPDTPALALDVISFETGKPVPGATISARWWHGAGVGKSSLRTDARGRARVVYPPDATRLQVFSALDGFADVRLDWTRANGRTVPEAYRLRLRTAVPIGGVVESTEGAPVYGARVILNENDQESGASGVERVGFQFLEAETDVAGRWRVERVSESTLPHLVLAVRHPDFVSGPARMLDDRPQDLAALRRAEFVLRLSAGESIHGSVVDPTGQPVEGAMVFVGSRHEQPPRQAVSDAAGRFVIPHCRAGTNLLTAEAPGFAARTVFAVAGNDATPARLHLDAGKPLRLRVVDSQGSPVEGIDIQYVAFEPDLRKRFRVPRSQAEYQARTDAEGRALWERAPDGPLGFAVQAPNRSPVTFNGIQAGGEERVWVLAGAEGAPAPTAAAAATKPSCVLTVRTPEGSPAVDAEVAPTRPGQPLVLGPAGLGGLLRPSMRRTDADGRVELSLPTDSEDRTGNAGAVVPGGETWILITHTTGIGRARWTPSATRLDVQLEAWAKVEGRGRQGADTAPLRRCTLSEGPVRPGDAPFVMERFEAAVEADARFAFPRVPPWPVRLACEAGGEGAVPGLPMAPEWEWGLLPAPGQTLQIDTGLEGRRVTLRWRPPDGVEDRVLGAFLAQPGPRPPADLLRQPEAAIAWMQRPEVWQALATARQWSLRAAKAGAWQAGAVPPGEYQLQVLLQPGATPRPGPLRVYGATVRVPPGNPGDPCDLGEVILEAVSE